MDIQKQVQKSVDALWAFSSLNLEVAKNASENAQKLVNAQVSKVFEKSGQVQNLKNAKDAQDFVKKSLEEQQKVTADAVQEGSELLQKYVKSAQTIVSNYCADLQKGGKAA